MKKKNRITAALLALVLGGIGVHRFYLGKIASGVLYLLFCWLFFIPAIIAFIEFIVLICMSDEEFDRRYNAYAIAPPTIVVNPTTEVTVKSDNTTYVEEVKKLYDLKVKGMITDEEFEQKKKMLL
ncbi:NINE protein [Barnesiella intestinihominis]